MAYDRASLDDGNAEQESQHGAFPEASVGLEGLIPSGSLLNTNVRLSRKSM